jgi:uncharacterized protein
MQIVALEEKIIQLHSYIAQFSSALVAFSGGIDSAFLCKITRDVLGRKNVLAITAVSASLPQKEKEQTITTAIQLDVPHQFIFTDELENEHYVANPVNRCYFCKSELYTKLTQSTFAKQYEVIFNGTNADDLGDFRPGIVAGAEYKILSPLAHCGFAKNDIRNEAQKLNIAIWNKPASPCLSSRIPYGESVTQKKLLQIEQAEDFLHSLGFAVCRVRHHDTIARIEIPPEDFIAITEKKIRMQINTRLKEIGFLFVTIDVSGFTSGSLNSVLLELPQHN